MKDNKELIALFAQYLEDNDLLLLTESLMVNYPTSMFRLHKEGLLIYTVRELREDLSSKKNRPYTLECIQQGVAEGTIVAV